MIARERLYAAVDEVLDRRGDVWSDARVQDELAQHPELARELEHALARLARFERDAAQVPQHAAHARIWRRAASLAAAVQLGALLGAWWPIEAGSPAPRLGELAASAPDRAHPDARELLVLACRARRSVVGAAQELELQSELDGTSARRQRASAAALGAGVELLAAVVSESKRGVSAR